MFLAFLALLSALYGTKYECYNKNKPNAINALTNKGVKIISGERWLVVCI